VLLTIVNVDIVKSKAFDDWLRGVRDPVALARITVRIDRMASGNPGDVKPVGGGITEMRIDYGPGYRLYCMQRGARIVLLCGGSKSTQGKDIRRAKAIAAQWRG
jgi:putative addiction module killer protein